jgi:hypothetical protein
MAISELVLTKGTLKIKKSEFKNDKGVTITTNLKRESQRVFLLKSILTIDM